MDTYLLEFLVRDPCASAHALRQQLRKPLPWAHELLVVGDVDLMKVHVRTGRPDLALGIGLMCGPLTNILLKPGPRVALDLASTSSRSTAS